MDFGHCSSEFSGFAPQGSPGERAQGPLAGLPFSRKRAGGSIGRLVGEEGGGCNRYRESEEEKELNRSAVTVPVVEGEVQMRSKSQAAAQ